MKALFIIILAAAVFGSAGYFGWRLYLKPKRDLEMEKQMGAVIPPDPTLPEFQKRLAAEEGQNLIEAQANWSDFIERFPESSKADEAKDRLGRINAALFLSPAESPDKKVYIVKPGDVITRVAAREKTTPELLMRVNNLQGSMLRIGQKLVIPPTDFSVGVDRRRKKVTLLNANKFFKQYAIMQMPTPSGKKAAGPTPKPPKIVGKVADRIAWFNGNRVTFNDKEINSAVFWVTVSPSGHSFYSEQPIAPGGPPQKPAGGGYVLAPQDLKEMAALLRKNDQVIID